MKKDLPIVLILVTAVILCSVPLRKYDIPLSWEGFYHIRIAQNFAHGQFFYDTGSFGPEGRVHVYPPVFHLLSGGLVRLVGVSCVERYFPLFLFCGIILVWYLFILRFYGRITALISSLFLLTVPAFVDLGFLLSPVSLALIFMFLAFFLVERPLLSGVLGGLVLMTQFTPFLFFSSVFVLWSLLDRKKSMKPLIYSFLVASPYLVYFCWNLPPLSPVLGNLGLKYFFVKATFVLPALALLGLRKDSFAISTGVSGVTLAALQPTNFCYVAFPLVLFSAFFVSSFFSRRKASIVIVFVFWLLFIPSQEYVSKLQPAASEYSSFVWLKENSLPSVVASGWYQAPVIATVSGRVPVLGFGFPERGRVEDMTRLYGGESDLLDYYDISYVYFGRYEQYDYEGVDIPLDRVYTGEGSLYKREPPLIYVVFTVDVEPDLPPVLSSYKGVEEGLPYLIGLLKEYGFSATYFVLGETAEKYPWVMGGLPGEIGCHSMYHEDMRALSAGEKEERVEEATAILRQYGEVTSFRCPGHSCDTDIIRILAEKGYTVEASACREISYPYYPSEDDWLKQGDSALLRVPVSHTPSYFYSPLVYPRPWVDAYMEVLRSQRDRRVKVVVIGLHPWEFIPLEAPGYESYTQACGKYSRGEVETLLYFVHTRRVRVVTMKELCEMWGLIER